MKNLASILTVFKLYFKNDDVFDLKLIEVIDAVKKPYYRMSLSNEVLNSAEIGPKQADSKGFSAYLNRHNIITLNRFETFYEQAKTYGYKLKFETILGGSSQLLCSELIDCEVDQKPTTFYKQLNDKLIVFQQDKEKVVKKQRKVLIEYPDSFTGEIDNQDIQYKIKNNPNCLILIDAAYYAFLTSEKKQVLFELMLTNPDWVKLSLASAKFGYQDERLGILVYLQRMPTY